MYYNHHRTHQGRSDRRLPKAAHNAHSTHLTPTFP
jgi:hypothetical protein